MNGTWGGLCVYDGCFFLRCGQSRVHYFFLHKCMCADDGTHPTSAAPQCKACPCWRSAGQVPTALVYETGSLCERTSCGEWCPNPVWLLAQGLMSLNLSDSTMGTWSCAPMLLLFIYLTTFPSHIFPYLSTHISICILTHLLVNLFCSFVHQFSVLLYATYYYWLGYVSLFSHKVLPSSYNSCSSYWYIPI